MVPAPSYVQGWGFQPRLLADGGVFEDARVMRTWEASLQVPSNIKNFLSNLSQKVTSISIT